MPTDTDFKLDWQVPLRGPAQRGWTREELQRARAQEAARAPQADRTWRSQLPAYASGPRPVETAPVPLNRAEERRLMLAQAQVHPVAREITAKYQHRLAADPRAVTAFSEFVNSTLQPRIVDGRVVPGLRPEEAEVYIRDQIAAGTLEPLLARPTAQQIDVAAVAVDAGVARPDQLGTLAVHLRNQAQGHESRDELVALAGQIVRDNPGYQPAPPAPAPAPAPPAWVGPPSAASARKA